MAELSLTLSVDGCHSDLVRRVGLQSCQHHCGWREEKDYSSCHQENIGGGHESCGDQGAEY